VGVFAGAGGVGVSVGAGITVRIAVTNPVGVCAGRVRLISNITKSNNTRAIKIAPSISKIGR